MTARTGSAPGSGGGRLGLLPLVLVPAVVVGQLLGRAVMRRVRRTTARAWDEED